MHLGACMVGDHSVSTWHSAVWFTCADWSSFAPLTHPFFPGKGSPCSRESFKSSAALPVVSLRRDSPIPTVDSWDPLFSEKEVRYVSRKVFLQENKYTSSGWDWILMGMGLIWHETFLTLLKPLKHKGNWKSEFLYVPPRKDLKFKFCPHNFISGAGNTGGNIFLKESDQKKFLG